MGLILVQSFQSFERLARRYLPLVEGYRIRGVYFEIKGRVLYDWLMGNRRRVFFNPTSTYLYCGSRMLWGVCSYIG